MKKNSPHFDYWDEYDEEKKFEDRTTISVCSRSSIKGEHDDDTECGLTNLSIDDDEDNKCGLTLTEMDDDECGLTLTEMGDDEKEDNLTTIGAGDFDDDFQQQSDSPNLYWRPEEFEPIKMDLSDLNKAFDWGNYSIGVVVEQIKQPSTGKLICYKVSPFCTGDPLIPEMFLETEKILQLGEWVQFDRSDLFAKQINPETFKPHAQMFRTLTYRLDVVMECEISVPKMKVKTIESKWTKWQTKLERENSQSQARFIHRFYDDFKMITEEHLGQDWWATVEYQRREHWGERKGYWRISDIRPRYYGWWDEQKENNGDDQKPCSSQQMK